MENKDRVPGTMPHDITIQPMRTEEKPEVRKMLYRSFPLIQRLFFSWTPHVLVAKREGQLLGAVMLKIYPLPRGRKGGFISWIFTDPKARGMGAGQRLIDASLVFFDSQGCHEIAACVEGYNTSSSKLFSTRGFSPLSPGAHLKRYGMGILPVWIRMFHYFDIGHFVWVYPGSTYNESPSLQWWGTLLANTLIMLLVIFRNGDLGPLTFVMVPLINMFFFGARWLAMKWTAACLGLKVRFRAWETGILASLGVALIFGGLFPAPGNAYPDSNNWTYRSLISKLGPMALAGMLPTLLISGIAWCLVRFTELPAGLDVWVRYALIIGSSLAFYDVVLFFFPFGSFNGRRILDWKRPLWLILAIAALIIFFI